MTHGRQTKHRQRQIMRGVYWPPAGLQARPSKVFGFSAVDRRTREPERAMATYFPAARRRVMCWRRLGILVLARSWMAVDLLAAMTGSVAYQ